MSLIVRQGFKTQSTVNHGQCNRKSYNSSALICVYLPVSAVLKENLLTADNNGLTQIHADKENRDIAFLKKVRYEF